MQRIVSGRVSLVRNLVKPTPCRMFSSFSEVNPFKRTDDFARRHFGPQSHEVESMLNTIGFDSMNALMESTIPEQIRLTKEMNVADSLTETEALEKIKSYAVMNDVKTSFIGTGYYGTVTPNVISRNMLENPGWYTAYTPYQAEISQGRLESLLNFQTMISDLTALPVANASLLDEGTAAAEAFNMANSSLRGKTKKFFIDSEAHPQTIEVMKTRAEAQGVEIVVGDPLTCDLSTKEFSGILVQYPSTYGSIRDFKDLAQQANKSKTMVIAAADILSLTHLTPPGDWGADIVVGSAQRFGVPMMYGGPHAGFISVKEKLMRKLPGRVIGISRDQDGNQCLRMAMQAREQHIRRDKATSNVCTAQALLANIAGAYGVYHGPDGLSKIGARVHRMASALFEGLRSGGYDVGSNPIFDTIRVNIGSASVDDIHSKAVAAGYNFRFIDENSIGLSVDETHQMSDISKVLGVFGIETDINKLAASTKEGLVPTSLLRTSKYMQHPVFNSHHSETQMMRYLKKLESKDFALNYCAIPLGSCTMKLNAASEMIPVSWPEFANMHPFAPASQATGYKKLIDCLHDTLCEVTGFAAMSSQPNSGAQGEFAGLMAIRDFHRSNNEGHRDICLIPASAHGTNPASAVMSGMKVIVVKNQDEDGSIDMEDLESKIEKHKDKLSALMITYPSTYGIFEESVKDIIDMVHSSGGQVYMDGANMNAQVGFTSPGHIGADVCHLNLHKTFAIPHGGGGPGVGSIGVAKHLAPFLPGHPVVPVSGEGVNVQEKSAGSISAAPFGSAGILPISWMYCNMLGKQGMTDATAYAVLNANYMVKKLENHFPVLYTGTNGQCAHEFIIDTRDFKHVKEEDVAKRLMDYGFHAPTMSWPVPGTLMIEPTESEPKIEIDRLINALIAIRGEIDEVETGKADPKNNVLKNAPHTSSRVLSDKWNYPYTREQAAFPTQFVKNNKFWPTVARVDNVFGDRNVICTCPPIHEYDEQETVVDTDDEDHKKVA